MNKLLSSFRSEGFTEVFDTGLNDRGKLDELKLLLYDLTKNNLIDQDPNINLEFLKLEFYLLHYRI